MAWEVDLQNPAWLGAVIDRYLSMGVVPVEGKPPAMLAEDTVRLVLPDGLIFESPGRMIRASGPNAFLVQLDRLPDLDVLRKASRMQKPLVQETPEAKAASGMPASTSLVDDLLSTISPEYLVFKEGAAQRPSQSTPRATPMPPPVESPVPGASAPEPRDPGPRTAGTSSSSMKRRATGEWVIEDPSAVPPVPPPHSTPPAAPPVAEPQAPQPSRPPSSPHWGKVPSGYVSVPELLEHSVEVDAAAAAGRPGSRTPPSASGVTGRETEYSDVYAKVKDLPLGEKQKLARHGRRTVRQILMRDPTKTLQRLVLTNPDILLDEVLEYANWPGLSKEALECIAQNPTWTSSRMVLLALVKNPSSPVDLAVRLVPRLGPAEWRLLTRTGVVRTPVTNAARKCLQNQPE